MVFIVGTPALAFSPGLDEAQQNTVVGGVVVDKNNEPLIGVSVMVEGSSGGTITNMDGKFSISLPKNKIRGEKRCVSKFGRSENI